MAQWKVPDELDARVRSFVESRGGDVDEFVHQVVRDQLDYESDPVIRAEAADKTRRGMADVRSGRVQDANEAMKKLADKHGLTPPE